ncbi:MAG: FAD binding domain-containing protein [Bacillota bacterium]
MIDYQFIKVNTAAEALKVLAEKNNVKIIAGGTDVLVELHKESEELESVDYLLDISGIEDLKDIETTENRVEIGSLVTHSRVLKNKFLAEKIPFLAAAAKDIGSTQIRNRGTVGGNVCNASPAADLFAPLLALEAEVILRSQKGKRNLKITDFIKGPYKTDIRNDELLEKVVFKIPAGEYYCNFQKIGRRKALNISRLCLAFLTVIEDGVIKKANLVPGAATPYPTPFKKIDDYLEGKLLSDIDPVEIGKMAADSMVEITGERWSTPYKRPALSKLAERAVSCVKKEAGYNA